MTTYTYAQVVGDIESVAKSLGIDPNLALATALVESGLDPSAAGDPVNGKPTSFGEYQLHQGGELGNLTQAQAENPTTNAQVALSEIKSVSQQNPGASPGVIAFLAQKPQGYTAGMTAEQAAALDPNSPGGQYITDVNTAYNNLSGSGSTSETPTQLLESYLGVKSLSAKAGSSTVVGTQAKPAPAPHGFLGAIGSDLLFVLKVAGQAIGGLIMFLLGLIYFLRSGTTGSLPELGWFLLGAGAVLLWSAVRLKNSLCVVGSAVSGHTSACSLQRGQGVPNISFGIGGVAGAVLRAFGL